MVSAVEPLAAAIVYTSTTSGRWLPASPGGHQWSVPVSAVLTEGQATVWILNTSGQALTGRIERPGVSPSRTFASGRDDDRCLRHRGQRWCDRSLGGWQHRRFLWRAQRNSVGHDGGGADRMSETGIRICVIAVILAIVLCCRRRSPADSRRARPQRTTRDDLPPGSIFSPPRPAPPARSTAVIASAYGEWLHRDPPSRTIPEFRASRIARVPTAIVVLADRTALVFEGVPRRRHLPAVSSGFDRQPLTQSFRNPVLTGGFDPCSRADRSPTVAPCSLLASVAALRLPFEWPTTMPTAKCGSRTSTAAEAGYALCAAHAERLSPPLGWTFIDRRTVVRLFAPLEVA